MADIDVRGKNRGSERSVTETKQGEGRGLARHDWSPFGFGLTPRDFFGMSPFALFRRMNDEMDRWWPQSWGRGGGWSPAVEVREQDGKLMVHADLPGLKPEDVKVEIANGILSIQGERKQEHEENERGFYRSERHYGHFCREIPLPEGVDTDKIQAQFQNGVLEVTVPVPESAANRRQIPIQGNK